MYLPVVMAGPTSRMGRDGRNSGGAPGGIGRREPACARHTFISRLVQAGRPLPEVAALAGHRDIMMTMRYAHLAPRNCARGIDSLKARGQRSVQYRRQGAPDSRVTLESREFGGNRVTAGGPNGIRTRV